MTKGQKVLLDLLSSSLFDKKIKILEADWDEVLQEAKSQSVVQIAYSALDFNKMKPEEISHWREASFTNLAQNIRVIHDHALLNKWIDGQRIPYVILKGCASAAYYPVPTFRTMGDVDFLVSIKDLKHAGEILEKQGLKSWEQEHEAHIVFLDEKKSNVNATFEMHFRVAGIPGREAGALIEEYLADIFQKSESIIINGGQIKVPSSFHHGIIILIHTCHHLTGEGIGLRHLCDWAVFENSFSNEEFREMFENKLKAVGLWEFAKILTRTAINYLGADEREWATCDERICESLIEDILHGGNFGKKDGSRTIQKMLISDRGKHGVGKTSMSFQFVRSANAIVMHRWPKARNNPFILVGGWLYFGSQRIVRESTGKRQKTNVPSVIDNAAKRREIYKQMHLYETED